MADTVIQLSVVGGDLFQFSRFEVPEHIAFGGKQRLAVHELVGGARVVDAMGRSDAPLQWSGLFQGENALARARFLDYLRISGKQCMLNWSELYYMVVVEEFSADFERFYQLPYRISFTVVQDLAQPITAIASAGVDEWVRADMTTANSLGELIGDGPLSASLGTLDTAIKAVSDFAKATSSVIASVTGPLAAVQQRVGILIASVGNTAANVGTFGGLIPNSGIASAASSFNSSASAMTQMPQLYNLQSTLGRMSKNLGTI